MRAQLAAAAGERRRVAQALLHQDPRGLLVREQVVDLVEQLEPRARGHAGEVRPDGQRRDDGAQRLDHRVHQPDRDVGQDLELLRRLVRVGEVPRQELEQDLVGHVEEVHAARRPRVRDQRHHDTRGLRPDVGRHDRPGGLEARIRLLELEVLVEDAEEAPEVRIAPLAAGPLALLDDDVDGAPCGREVGDGDELRPAEVLLGRLGVRRPDEQALRAEPLVEVLQAGLDGPVELADRVELLELGDDLVVPRRGAARRPGAIASNPSASSTSIPSGRSRKAKWRRAASPNGMSSIRTPAG